MVSHDAFPKDFVGDYTASFPTEKYYDAWGKILSSYNKAEKKFRASGSHFPDIHCGIPPFDGGDRASSTCFYTCKTTGIIFSTVTSKQ